MEEKNIEIVKSYFRLVNEEKFDEFFDLFDPNIDLSAPYGFHADGIEDVRTFYLKVPADYPEHVDTAIAINANGNKVAALIDFIGTNNKGQVVKFMATDWFVIENGKIKKLNIFYDSHDIAKKLRAQK